MNCTCPTEAQQWAEAAHMVIWCMCWAVGAVVILRQNAKEDAKRRAEQDALWAEHQRLMANLENWLPRRRGP